MPENKSQFVLLCQQALATGTVLAVIAPAASMLTLDIVAPTPQTAVGGAASPQSEASLVATEPVEPDVTEVTVDGVDPAGLDALTGGSGSRGTVGKGLAALSAPEQVTGYATIGVSWDPGPVVSEEDITVSVRTTAHDIWSDWEDVEYHDDHGPDPESTEGGKIRPGTDPIVVGDVDLVQVKAVITSGKAPAGMTMAVVDPGDAATAEVEEPAIDTAELGDNGADDSLVSAETSLAAGGVAKPKIYSRAQWGADERMRDPGSLRYGTIKAGFVHHTVNANGYTADQVPSLIRGIYAYHTQSLGWSDVGYNFIVDRFGRIWEGRYGGVSRPVVGAHTLGYNDYSFAMSALGNFETVQPPAVLLDAYGRLFAWKLSLHGIDAQDASQQVGSGTFRAISGHRDAGQTACPGRYLYAKLPTIRDLAAKYQKGGGDPDPPPPDVPVDPKRDADLSGSSWPDLVVRDRTSERAYVVQTGGQLAFEKASDTGRSWEGMDLLTGSRDLTGDRIADMVARDKQSKASGIYPGNGRGGFGAAVASTIKFRGSDQLTSVRDFDGDGENDLVSRDSGTKALYLHPGNGDGGFLGKRLLASSWNYDLTFGVGDFDRDGRFDLAARDRDGSVAIFSSKANGLGAPTTLPGNSWDDFDLISGLGDLTNDGDGDIIARNATSRQTYLYPGNGRGGLGERLGPFKRFKAVDFLTAPGQVSGSKRFDLVGRQASGRMVAYANTGRKNISDTSATGDVLDTANLVLNVGDWNDDGHGDLMTRSSASGRMYFRKGNGKGHFAEPVRAGTGWAKVSSISPVGDVTGDGNPDLVGRPAGEAMKLYPGDGRSGFRDIRAADSQYTSRLSAGSPDRYDWMLNVGDANGDKVPDLIAREKATGKLWLMPGAGKGYDPRRLIADGFSGYDLGG